LPEVSATSRNLFDDCFAWDWQRSCTIDIKAEMALKGQEDPRWIVANRDDGKNVNNWHWFDTWCRLVSYVL
jgi:hypothetical protein